MPSKLARGLTRPTSPICSPSPRSRSNMARPRTRRSLLCCTMRSRIRAGRRRSRRFGAAMASGSPGSSRRARTRTNYRNHPGGIEKRRLSSGSAPSRIRCGLVVAADKLHNVRDVLRNYRIHGDDLWSHFKGGRDGTLWYYRAVVGRASSKPQSPRSIRAECHHCGDRSTPLSLLRAGDGRSASARMHPAELA